MHDLAVKPGRDRETRDLTAAVPLYGASLVVTLAGVGAVGVTIALSAWTPMWVMLTIIGHAVSFGLRRMRLSAETVFYPVMAGGILLLMTLVTRGSPMLGVDQPLATIPADMATAAIVGCLAVIRSFTLVTDGALLFSPVPAISMLALVGSTNPNAEVPLFFGLLLLGSLFISGYESHLRRMALTHRAPGSVLPHLIGSWVVTLAVCAVGLLFPILIKPAIGPLSPFAIPAVRQLNSLINFTQPTSGQVQVGQGPIVLSAAPLFELHTSSRGRLLRADVLPSYTGRGWRSERQPLVVDLTSADAVNDPLPADLGEGVIIPMFRYRFKLPRDPDLPQDVKMETVRSVLITRGHMSDGIPAPGRIREVVYPQRQIFAHSTGAVSGSGHLSPDKIVELVSEVPDYPAERLRRAHPVDPASFDDPETLALPQSTYPVQQLARQLVRDIRSPYDRVETFVRYIEKNCSYTLEEAPTPPGEDAAAYYLFDSKRGACDLAATAVAVMCRSVGIPARVGVGYAAEEELPDRTGFLIRRHHAHMWVEVFFPGYGWVPFDPAPTLTEIRNNPLQIAFYRLQSALARIGGGGLDALMFVGILLLTLAMAAWAGWRRLAAWCRKSARTRRLIAGSPVMAVEMAYAQAVRLFDRRGWGREAWMTPHEYRDAMETAWSTHTEALEALRELTTLYVRARYAGEASEADLRAALESVVRLSRLTPARPRPKRKGRTAAPGKLAPARGGS